MGCPREIKNMRFELAGKSNETWDVFVCRFKLELDSAVVKSHGAQKVASEGV